MASRMIQWVAKSPWPVGSACGLLCYYLFSGFIYPVVSNYFDPYNMIANKWDSRTHLDPDILLDNGLIVLFLLLIYVKFKGRFSNFLLGFCGTISGLVCYFIIDVVIYGCVSFHLDPSGSIINRWDERTHLPIDSLFDPGLLVVTPCLIYIGLNRHAPKFLVAFCVSILIVGVLLMVYNLKFPDY